MSDPLNPVRRLVARIRALLPEDWRGKAGEHFRETLESVSEFAEEHNVRPRDLAGEGVELGRRKLQGLANKELASATKDFADAEQTKIETELKRRSLESRVRKEEAETRIAEAKALDAEVELFAKMEKIGVVFRYDENGTAFVLPAPKDLDFKKLVQRRLALAERNETPETRSE